MPLAQTATGHIVFDKAAIMRRAYQIGRLALQLARARHEPVSEINHTLSNSLRKAWAEAKAEAGDLTRRVEAEAATRRALAARAAEAVALAGHYGHDEEAIREAIASEHYRDHMNFAAIDRLQAALGTVRS